MADLVSKAHPNKRDPNQYAKDVYDAAIDGFDRQIGKGVCAGMVCLWAGDFLKRQKEAEDLDEKVDWTRPDNYKDTAALFQGIYKGEGIREVYKQPFLKLIDPNYQEKTIDQSLRHGQEVLYKQQKLELGSPESIPLAQVRDAALAIKKRLDGSSDMPFVLSLQVAGGHHAIGVVQYDNEYYVFDPNGGLYNFTRANAFEAEVSNYLRSECAVSSTVVMTSIAREVNTTSASVGSTTQAINTTQATSTTQATGSSG